MRPVYLATLAAALLFSCLSAQDNSAKKFAGTWEAKFNGATFLVLKIHTDGEITGSMSNFDLDVDEDGNLRSAVARDGEAPIHQAKATNESMTFEWNPDADEASLKFELKKIGEDQGQLRVMAGDAKIKPFNLTKLD